MTLASVALASSIVAGCLAGAGTYTAVGSVRTMPLLDVVNQAEALRGQVVRTCGTRFRRIDVTEAYSKWKISIPMSIGWHPAEMEVQRCGDHEPKVDKEGCITGRIARHDGSLRVPGPHEPLLGSDPGSTPYWALHAQCPTR